ncbi:MAG: HNH endonuclease [Spirochaetaceae bacterium]|jgi:5-methylcytosine-specific restriction endonuclease McrA|nr:HNH endonuclease [Spirochaetaceae bacterium]
MLDHKKAMNLWEQTYGKVAEARDARGRLMYKAAYGQKGSKYGWDVHHKRPKKQGGTDTFDNLEIVHMRTHDELHNR